MEAKGIMPEVFEDVVVLGSGPAGYTAGTGRAAALAAVRWLTEQSGISLAPAGRARRP